jgi:hypothetical protein
MRVYKMPVKDKILVHKMSAYKCLLDKILADKMPAYKCL